MSQTLSAIFWGVVTFSLIVFLHEGGHFIAARAFGVRVHEFFIGLPGPSLSFKRKNTRYGITAIPLGGYVRIAGMEGDSTDEHIAPFLRFLSEKKEANHLEIDEFFQTLCDRSLVEDEEDSLITLLKDWGHISYNDETALWECSFEFREGESDEELLARAKEGTYLGLNRFKRIVILLSGVAVNLVLALAVFTIILSAFGTYDDLGAIRPVQGGPAELSGLQVGDRIISLNSVKVSSFDELTALIAQYEPGTRVYVEYSRADVDSQLAEVALVERPDSGSEAYMGVSPYFEHVDISVSQALVQSVGYVRATLEALIGFFKPSTFQQSVSQSSSIVGISVMTAKAAESSLLDYAWIVAAISLSLGIMNALPIPPLDGGKVLMEIIGAIRKKDVSLKIQTRASIVGFSLLMVLVVVLMFNDISRFF